MMRVLKRAYDQLRFQTKVMTLTSLLILIIFLALTIYIRSIIAQNIEDEVGQKALAVSQTIAQNEKIIAAFGETEPQLTIQPLTKQIQENIGAEFIVVGDKNEIRYSHALEDRIGKKMVGDDNERALSEGKAYVSKKKGSLGLSIRGKSPIVKDGEVIGVVSVGYLLDDVKETVREKNKPIFMLLIFFLILGMAGSALIANHLKKLLYNMEPNEIAQEHLQKEAILRSAREGIIAVDSHNRITLLNNSAKEILHAKDVPDKEMLGKALDSFTDIPLLDYVTEKDQVWDREFILNDEAVLMNTFALETENQQFGAVATFRKKTDLEKVTKELDTIKQYTEGLRSQAHEFSNKIHTILGLLQLGHHEEAMDFIRKDQEIQTARRHIIMDHIQEPAIQGLLIAKYNQASEKGIEFMISGNSQLEKVRSEKHKEVLLKVLGNLIDNAFSAVNAADKPLVETFITDIGKDTVIEVDDNGSGIDAEEEGKIFKNGYTTKVQKGHGTGLYLVEKAVHSVKGHIFLDASEIGGTRFVVIIPKEVVHNEEI